MNALRIKRALIEPMIGPLLIIGVVPLCLGADVCVSNPGTGPEICVKWNDGGQDPQPGTDFIVDFADQANPNLRLLEGSLTWEVWSKNGSNPGNLGTLTTEDSENYAVKIANGTNPGAVNFKGGTLDPAGDNYSSILAGSRITGNLTGNLGVVVASGIGGTLSMTIDGDATGDVSIPRLSRLHVGGSYSGALMVTQIIQDGVLDIRGNVALGSVITLNALTEGVLAQFGYGAPVGDFSFRGTLNLPGGVPTHSDVQLFSELIDPGFIDLQGSDIAPEGELKLEAGGDGSIVNGGLMAGYVRLAAEFGFAFSGTATFDSVQAITGSIRTETGDIAGTVVIENNMDGSIAADPGNLTSTGTIAIGGNLNGYIWTNTTEPGTGSIQGTIEVMGSMSGFIASDTDLAGTVTIHGDCAGEFLSNWHSVKEGDITGDVIVEGRFNGNICGDNLPPIPGNVDIQDPGCAYTVCGARSGIIGYPLAPADGCRYFAITPEAGETAVAIKVTKDCGGTEPNQNCLDGFVQYDSDSVVHGTLGAQADYQLPTAWGTVYVGDALIVPENEYLVQTIIQGGSLSAPKAATTSLWGDTNQSGGFIDVDDILCELDAFVGTFNGSCTPRSADLAPCEPNRVIDVDDILAVLNAFVGTPFGVALGCSDPCDSGMEPMGGGDGGSIDASTDTVASATEIKPGRTVVVRVFVTSDVDVRAFQVAVSVGGGTSGTLSVEEIAIEDTRTDYLFYSLSDVTAIDEGAGRAAGALYTGDAGAASARYLGSFTLRASSNAAGAFTISANTAGTLLRDADAAAIGWESGAVAEVIVE